jgi:phosphoglycolate phosphatase
MTIKNIIFDFDGTIADTANLVIEMINSVRVKEGKPVVEEDEIERLRQFTVRKRIKELGVKFYQIPGYLRLGQKMMNEKITHCDLQPHAKEVIEELSKKYNLWILSTNSVENIEKFLKDKIDLQYFQAIYSKRSLFGKHRKIISVMKENNLIPEETVYVGDESRDINAAHKAGIKIISVSNGFESDIILNEFNPDALIPNFSEMQSAIQSL